MLNDRPAGSKFRAEYSVDYYFYGSIAWQTRQSRKRLSGSLTQFSMRDLRRLSIWRRGCRNRLGCRRSGFLFLYHDHNIQRLIRRGHGGDCSGCLRRGRGRSLLIIQLAGENLTPHAPGNRIVRCGTSGGGNRNRRRRDGRWHDAIGLASRILPASADGTIAQAYVHAVERNVQDRCRWVNSGRMGCSFR